MKVKCKHCLPKEGIEVPAFSLSDKNRLFEIKQESSIKTVKFLMDNYKLSHLESKYITAHINDRYGKCNRCSFNDLVDEYVNCPKCGALNFNWKVTNK
ncbi:hypothetical protein [Flammeovirga sp. EKP202]|uniref:hypothetical protein n=1 Tax=Flammeovirga sp. EKP202 TaxID=2770592 RepID=UPI00165ECDB3|nr:hypothetical protein [Flammeovirga sp. EKP202]MBD0404491.1 hypothetical protein [Flammeovirga sp. EKP202]